MPSPAAGCSARKSARLSPPSSPTPLLERTQCRSTRNRRKCYAQGQPTPVSLPGKSPRFCGSLWANTCLSFAESERINVSFIIKAQRDIFSIDAYLGRNLLNNLLGHFLKDSIHQFVDIG